MARQKTVEINGKKFKLQSIPFKSYCEINDRHTNKHGVLLKTGYIEELLKHCVIEPKVTMSDFDDDFDTAGKLVLEIESFLKTKVDTDSSKAKGEE